MNLRLWSRLLALEGCMLVGIGMGWGFGVWSGAVQTPALVIFAGGVLSILVSQLFRRSLETSDVESSGPFRAVDLADSFKAARAFGSQTPLFDELRLKSEVVTVGGEHRLSVPQGSKMLLEHWEGPEVWVASGHGKRLKLSRGQMMRLTPEQGDVALLQARAEYDLGRPVETMLVSHVISPD